MTMKNLLLELLRMKIKRGEPLQKPALRTIYPDIYVSEYVWFHLHHVSCRWAKDYFARTAVEKYFETIK
jgi:hypothetical protein